MADFVIMPRQGQSVESCILTEIYKKKGDKVSAGDLLFAYETDKASFEEESQFEGIVLDVFFSEGDEIPVLSNVMVIGAEGESVGQLYQESGKETVSKETETSEIIKETPKNTEQQQTTIDANAYRRGDGDESFVSPRAKMLAEEKGVDVSLLTGTGPAGRIIERDVQQAAADSKLSPLAKKKLLHESTLKAGQGTGLDGTVIGRDLLKKGDLTGSGFEIKPLSNMRKLIARAMHESLQNSAQLTHHLGADARNILALRKKVKAQVDQGYPVNITLNDMICFAVIKALKKFPQVNAHFMGDSLKLFDNVHLGLAVDTERGLMVPAIKNADALSIQELAVKFKEVAAACRKGNVDPDLLASGAASFTVSNLGNYGVEIFTPVINLPQVAILGVNTIVPRPKDLGDGVYGFVPYLGLSLTYDHRALDGGEATRFVKQVAVEIENLEFDPTLSR